MYITEWGNNHISIFTTDGQYNLLEDKVVVWVSFNEPHGITFDREGYLYVCDFSNNRLIVY